MRSMSRKYSEYRSTLRSEHYLIFSTDAERIANPPPGILKEDWVWLVRYWGSENFKV